MFIYLCFHLYFSVFIYLCFVTSPIFSPIFFCVSLLMFCDAFFTVFSPFFPVFFPFFHLTHNPEVGGSKPLSAKVFYCIFPLKDRAKETVNTAFFLLIFCDFMVSYKVTVICVSVLLARWM